MRCNRCGQENEENARYCDSCGNELSNSIENKIVQPYLKSEPMKNVISVISYAGAISILGGIIAIFGSFKMTQIKSVSGNSIAESFYSSFGIFGIGFGLFMIAVGIYICQRRS